MPSNTGLLAVIRSYIMRRLTHFRCSSRCPPSPEPGSHSPGHLSSQGQTLDKCKSGSINNRQANGIGMCLVKAFEHHAKGNFLQRGKIEPSLLIVKTLAGCFLDTG